MQSSFLLLFSIWSFWSYASWQGYFPVTFYPPRKHHATIKHYSLLLYLGIAVQYLGLRKQPLRTFSVRSVHCTPFLLFQHLAETRTWMGLLWPSSLTGVKERWYLGAAIWGSKRLFCTCIFSHTVNFQKRIYSLGLLWELQLFLRWN